MLTDVTASCSVVGLSVDGARWCRTSRPDSPASAPASALDVIPAVDSRAVGTNDELIREISARQPGTPARLQSSATAAATT